MGLKVPGGYTGKRQQNVNHQFTCATEEVRTGHLQVAVQTTATVQSAPSSQKRNKPCLGLLEVQAFTQAWPHCSNTRATHIQDAKQFWLRDVHVHLVAGSDSEPRPRIAQ